MNRPSPPQSQVVFLYFDDLDEVAPFFEEILGFEKVEDQSLARIYRVAGNAFIGIVDGAKGYHRPQPKNAVIATMAVPDVPAWYDYLQSKGVRLLTKISKPSEIQVEAFFFEGPGGYVFEVQRFLKPGLQPVFHPKK